MIIYAIYPIGAVAVCAILAMSCSAPCVTRSSVQKSIVRNTGVMNKGNGVHDAQYKLVEYHGIINQPAAQLTPPKHNHQQSSTLYHQLMNNNKDTIYSKISI